MKINRKITGICTHEENEDASIIYSIKASYDEKWEIMSELREFFFGKKAINCIVDKKISGVRENNI
jgi:hypothetical protein